MKQPRVYIGFKEIRFNGQVSVTIAISPISEVFTGEYHEITADWGEGSCGYWFVKLKNNQDLKGGEN